MKTQTPLEAIRTIKSGVLFQVIAMLLLAVHFLYLLDITFTLRQTVISVSQLALITRVMAFIFVVFILAVIVAIVGVLLMRKGFGALAASGLNVGIGRTGATAVLIGFILMLIGAFLPTVAVGTLPHVTPREVLPFLQASHNIQDLGGVIVLVGIILLAIGFYKLGSIYNNGLVKWGGILSIFLGFIGYILVYIGLGSVIRNLSSGYPQPYYAPQQSYGQAQVYQVGQGVLRPDGYASFTLYSPYQATIVGGYIEGLGISAASFAPNVLFPGNNSVTAYFGNVGALQRGVTYVIVLTVNVQGSTTYVRVNATYQ